MGHQTFLVFQIKTYIIILKMLCRIVIALLIAFCDAAPGRYYKRKPMAPVAKAAPLGDVVDVAVGAGAFTTLVKIVSDLGLVDILKGVEAVTIFAPSDEAFAKLPAGTLESLTTEQAKAIVSRHVVAGASVLASEVVTGNVATFGGEMVGLVKTDEGGVQVAYNGQTVNVVSADVKANNGVIHVIDAVIL